MGVIVEQPQVETTYTETQLTEALGLLDDEAQQLVLNALRQQTEQREAEQAEEEFQKSIVCFAVVYERAASPNASDSNIEGWYEQVEEEAGYLLTQYNASKSYNAVEELARHTAALAYVHLNLEHDDGSRIDQDMLTQAGVSPEVILQTIKEFNAKSYLEKNPNVPPDQATSVVDNVYRSLLDLAYKLGPLEWRGLIEPAAASLRARLKEADYQLPELNEEGEYGRDDEGFEVSYGDSRFQKLIKQALPRNV